MNAHSTTQRSGEPEVDLGESTILIVDDNQQNLELLQAYLDELPGTILTASDGVAAMAIIDSEPVDLVLLDVMMPKMSGFEVCKKLKSSPRTRSIPIIMVTALNELGDIERGVESGTDDFLSKPVKKLELLTRVKSLLRVRYLKRELDRTLAYIQRIDEQDQQVDDNQTPGQTPDQTPE
jgi:two-component system cell cycle response regulator